MDKKQNTNKKTYTNQKRNKSSPLKKEDLIDTIKLAGPKPNLYKTKTGKAYITNLEGEILLNSENLTISE